MPAYAVALGFFYALTATSSSGINQAAADFCAQYVWRNVLFVNNFFPYSDLCMGWSWSIAVEVQMYLVSPPIVWATLVWPRRAGTLLGVLAAVSLALYLALSSFVYSAAGQADDDGVLFTDWVYDKPYTPMFAYLFGMLVALWVERDHGHTDRNNAGGGRDSVRGARDVESAGGTANPNNARTKSDNNAAGARSDNNAAQTRSGKAGWRTVILPRWAASLLVLTVVICTEYAPDVQEEEAWLFWLQTLLARPLFCAGMAYVMYDLLSPRCAGDWYHALVSNALSSGPLYFLAQLSYGIYLFHFTYIMVGYYEMLQEPVRDDRITVNSHWIFPVFALTFYAMSTATALVDYFLIEKPMMNLGAITKQQRGPSGPGGAG